MKSDDRRAACCYAAALTLILWSLLRFPAWFSRLPEALLEDRLSVYCCNAIHQLLTFGLPALLILYARRARWADYKGSLRPVSPRKAAVCGLAALSGTAAVSMIAWASAQLIRALTGYTGGNELLPAPQGAAQWGLALAAVAVLPALCEELLFRALIQGVIFRRLPRAGIWLAALAFAALHRRWDVFPALLLIGAALGRICRRHGFYAAWLTHALYNAAVLIFSARMTQLSLPFALVCAAVCASALWWLIGKEQTDETDGAGL